MKALLVQPHSDDILFSCSHILFGEGIVYDEIKILTVENSEKRFKEDLKLKEFFPNLEIEVLPFVFEDHSHYTYFKAFKKLTPNEALEHLIETIGDGKIKDYIFNLKEKIEEEKKSKDLHIYSPLGIGHPTHFLVSEILEKEAKFFYREWPHSYKRRNKENLAYATRNKKLFYKNTNNEIIAAKFDIAKKVYKSQSSLLFFESGHIKNLYPEEIYDKKD